jgi:hypothetical protein
VDSFPVIPDFRFGNTHAPVSLDTGSTGSIGLFQSALGLPGIGSALHEIGTITRTGARQSKIGILPVRSAGRLGPFTLPAGLAVSTYKETGRSIRALPISATDCWRPEAQLLLDYRARTMNFYGNCG